MQSKNFSDLYLSLIFINDKYRLKYLEFNEIIVSNPEAERLLNVETLNGINTSLNNKSVDLLERF